MKRVPMSGVRSKIETAEKAGAREKEGAVEKPGGLSSRVMIIVTRSQQDRIERADITHIGCLFLLNHTGIAL